jgi:BirA family biotin operon repressor/biotin-[acetyl-CoA-carboxylase] ligase
MCRFDATDLDQIRHSTPVETIEHFPEVPSTNSRAMTISGDSSLRLPALVLTDLQTAGRGRGSNQWWSAAGALTFSLVMSHDTADMTADCAPISLTAAMAVCESLQQLRPGLEIGLKWPNDVYVQSRKLCGILVEVPPQSWNRVVLGVGMNINNSVNEAPKSIQAAGTSMFDVTGYRFNLTLVLVRVLQQLFAQLNALARRDSQLIGQWQAWCMLTDRRVRVSAGPQQIAGRCRGIDQDGALMIDTASGTQRCVTGIVSVLD